MAKAYTVDSRLCASDFDKIYEKFEQENDANLTRYVRRMITKDITNGSEVVDKIRVSINEIGQKINEVAKRLHEKKQVSFIDANELKKYQLDFETVLVSFEDFVKNHAKKINIKASDLDFSGDKAKKKKRVFASLNIEEALRFEKNMAAWGYSNKGLFVRNLLINDSDFFSPTIKNIMWEVNKVNVNLDQMRRYVDVKNLTHIELLNVGFTVQKLMNELLNKVIGYLNIK